MYNQNITIFYPVWRRLHAQGSRVPDGAGELQVQRLFLLPNRPRLQEELLQHIHTGVRGPVHEAGGTSRHVSNLLVNTLDIVYGVPICPKENPLRIYLRGHI